MILATNGKTKAPESAQGDAAQDRRRFMTAAGGGLVLFAALGLMPRAVLASPKDAKKKLAELTGGAKVQKGRVTLQIPAVTDQASFVPISVRVDSPMTEADHVTAIHVLAERNTVPDVASFHLSPLNGQAEISTRIRVRESQIILAAAEMNDGSVFLGRARCRIVGGAGGCG